MPFEIELDEADDHALDLAWRRLDRRRASAKEPVEKAACKPGQTPDKTGRKGSYFDDCPRDETGHCEPRGEADQTGKKPAESNSESSNEGSASIDQQWQEHAAEVGRRWQERQAGREKRRSVGEEAEQDAQAFEFSKEAAAADTKLQIDGTDAGEAAKHIQADVAKFGDGSKAVADKMRAAGASDKEVGAFERLAGRYQDILGKTAASYSDTGNRLVEARKAVAGHKVELPPEPDAPEYKIDPDEPDAPDEPDEEPVADDYGDPAEFEDDYQAWEKQSGEYSKAKKEFDKAHAEWESTVERNDKYNERAEREYDLAHSKWESAVERAEEVGDEALDKKNDLVFKLEDKVRDKWDKFSETIDAANEKLGDHVGEWRIENEERIDAEEEKDPEPDDEDEDDIVDEREAK